MLNQLFDAPVSLAALIAVLAMLNYVLGLLLVREHARQNFVEREAYPPVSPDGRVRSDRARLALPFLGTAVVIVVALVVDREIREVVAGGWFVMQVVGCGYGLADLLSARALHQRQAAEGHIRYSAAYLCRNSAARLVGTAFMTGAVAVLFRSAAFVAGSLFLLATAVGWVRRASKMARTAG